MKTIISLVNPNVSKGHNFECKRIIENSKANLAD